MILRLDRPNEGCLIDGSKESVRLGLKSPDPGVQLTDKARVWEQGQGSSGQMISAGLIRETRTG